MSTLNRKIKILYQILPFVIGGTERFLFNLIENIDKERFEPIVISHAQGQVISLFKSLGIQTKIIDSKSSRGFKNLITFLKKSEVDIAQTNGFYPILALAVNAACISHIWFLDNHIRVACPCLKLERRRYFLNIISLLSRGIVCPSEFIKGQLKNIRTPKIKIIYFGENLDKMKSIYSDYTLLKRFSCSNNYFAIAMIAYLIPHKRHIDFILAAKRVKRYLPNTKFFIFGSSYPSMESLDYANYLYKTVKKIGLDKDIIFAGFYKDILRAMAGIDLIVLPSINEGSSNAIVEAMALGKPVVVSDSGGNPELIEDRVTGLLVPTKNPQRLAEAIIEVLKNPQKAKMMGEAGRKRARRLFDIKRIVRQYEELYQEVYREPVKS